MGNYNYVRRNGYAYTSKAIKESIEKNKFVKTMRAKLMKEKFKVKFS